MQKSNIHPYKTNDDTTRYAVAVWVDRANQWQAPLDKETQRATGCRAEFARRLENMRTFADLAAAKRYAMRTFGWVQEED